VAKEFALSIVIRTVDKATAGIQSITAALDKMTAPTKAFGKAFGKLKEASAADKVVEGFKGVGSAVMGVTTTFGALALGVGTAVYAVAKLAGEFDSLGSAAARIGVGVDKLAGLRYAAKMSGTSVEALDQGIQTFNQNMGQLKAGKGKMLGFLETVSPNLARQMKASKSQAEALALIQEGASKLSADPEKLTAFMTATFGDASLGPMMARGAKGIKALEDEHKKYAGSLEDAAAVGGKFQDQLNRFEAVLEGLKGKLLASVGPPLLDALTKLTDWLVAHRADIDKWIDDFGKKLPDAIDYLKKKFTELWTAIKPTWDAMGGFSGAAKILAGVIGLMLAVSVGKLVLAFGQLSIALLTTPFGWLILTLAAVAAGVLAIVKACSETENFWGDMWLGMVQILKDVYEDIKKVIDNTIKEIKGMIDFITDNAVVNWVFGSEDRLKPGQRLSPAQARSPLPGAPGGSEAKIEVEFSNAPKGTKITATKKDANIDMTVGYQLEWVP
jgi:hypothetical protein